MSDKYRGHTPEENEAYSNFIGSYFDEVDMSNKAFEKFQKDNDHAMRADYIAFGALAIIKWVKRAWQVAIAAERDRCVAILNDARGKGHFDLRELIARIKL